MKHISSNEIKNTFIPFWAFWCFGAVFIAVRKYDLKFFSADETIVVQLGGLRQAGGLRPPDPPRQAGGAAAHPDPPA